MSFILSPLRGLLAGPLARLREAAAALAQGVQRLARRVRAFVESAAAGPPEDDVREGEPDGLWPPDAMDDSPYAERQPYDFGRDGLDDPWAPRPRAGRAPSPAPAGVGDLATVARRAGERWLQAFQRRHPVLSAAGRGIWAALSSLLLEPIVCSGFRYVVA